MTTFNLTCEAVEATLPDYLDETLEPWVRISIEEHLGECAHCDGLARELRNITREASSLPGLVPEREIWPRIAGRIGAPLSVPALVAESEPLPPTTEPVVLASDAPVPISEPTVMASEPPVQTTEAPVVVAESLPASSTPPIPTTVPVYALPDRREKRWGPGRMGLAAAALVLVTAGTTSLLTVQWLGRAHALSVVSSDTSARRTPSRERPAAAGSRGPSAEREQVAFDSSTPTPPLGQLGSALTVSQQVSPSPEEVVYDKEINKLQRIVRRQNAALDASTVSVIERNLRSLDSAIAQIRAALQKDPGSSLLDDQASRALEMKVELLRRAAMLKSST